MYTLFISDLHLSPKRPELTDAFIAFLKQHAYDAEAVYILGDLFDFWIGDDDPSPFAQLIKVNLTSLVSAGVPCFFTQGNRDFLLGGSFAKTTGVSRLPDEKVIELYGKNVLLMHGDTLCTDDIKYLAYRERIQQPWLKFVYRLLPFPIKQKIVQKVQGNIQEEKQLKASDIMDVTQSAVEDVMQKHQVDYLIHGHTHRPAHHQFISDGKDKHRFVLGDWDKQWYALKVDHAFDLEVMQSPVNHR